MNRYNIRKVFVWPAFKFGVIIGAVLMIIPGIVSGLVAHSVVDGLKQLVEALGGFSRLGGPDTSEFARQLQALINMGPLIVLWTTLLTIVLGGLWCGVTAVLAALVYNLVAGMGGGLEVGAQAVAASVAPQAVPAMPQPVPQVGPTAAAAQPQAWPQPQPQAVPVAQHQPPAAPPVQPPVAQPVQAPPVIQPSGPWLALSANPAQRWSLRPDCTRLGSAAGNEIVLPGLAPQHAEVRQENGIYVLYDLAAGQSWVNGRPVAGRNMLKEGFQIRLGGQDLVFHAG